MPEASRTKQLGFTQAKAVQLEDDRRGRRALAAEASDTTGAAEAPQEDKDSFPMRREASEQASGEMPAESGPWREPADEAHLSSDEEEDTEDTKRERVEVQAALSKALERFETFAARTRASGKRSAEEDAAVTQMLIRVRILLQQDSDDEDEDLTAKIQGAAKGSGDAAKSDPEAAAGSQPTLPQATQYMKDKGYESIGTLEDGKNIVHVCCEDSQKTNGMQLVLNQLLKHPEAPSSFPNDRNQWGWAPLHIVANGKDSFGTRPAMIMSLAHMKAGVEAKRGNQYMTPLHIACSTGHVSGAEALMLSGADPTVANKEGTTCWDLAAKCSDEMVQTLERVAARQGSGATGLGRLISKHDICLIAARSQIHIQFVYRLRRKARSSAIC